MKIIKLRYTILTIDSIFSKFYLVKNKIVYITININYNSNNTII